MSTLALVGSGDMGGTVARLAIAAGLDVVLSNSRGPQTVSDLVERLGKRATAATVERAARAGDWIVLAVPFGAYQRLPIEPLAGKVVLETTNYFGPPGELVAGTATSSELVQRHLVGARVVKAFNTILPRQLYNLARPAGAPDRATLTRIREARCGILAPRRSWTWIPKPWGPPPMPSRGSRRPWNGARPNARSSSAESRPLQADRGNSGLIWGRAHRRYGLVSGRGYGYVTRDGFTARYYIIKLMA